MNAAAHRVAIVGLGLIGGSLALAIRRTGFAGEVLAYDTDPAALRDGLAKGVIDASLNAVGEAVECADLIVLCVPNMVAADLLVELLQAAALRTAPPVITDVASVKGNLHARVLREFGSLPPYLVLGHPIAGSERSGVGAADADLFARHRAIITPESNADAAAVQCVRDMWTAAGAEVVSMDVAEHDRILAATSHLPHVLAYCLVDALARSPISDEIFRFAAGGFRDFTRIASSNPLMWRDVALANREALLLAVDEFVERLAVLRAAIDAGDGEALLETFTAAKMARDAALELQAPPADP